ncbi:hypothetical protein [Paenibacillus sp. OV219]|uniref:hypothetical protein n=1 Tax=Paenibacillus sp. OV219 TaxID=1884377 RepID=UPI0008C7243F|nr:hypothetical protein [Paenibacillus sp. OV219]SEM91420.1 hypothetical protein SAMN05518847_1011132 [Paenibacillus sp. OV219]
MANTTGVIQNNVPNPAAMVTVILSNDDVSTTGIVELELFVSFGGALTPIVHELFSISPLITMIRTYSVAGGASFEVQYNVSNTPDVIINVFSTDSGGNLIGAQRVLSIETQEISQLKPVP